MPFSPRLGGECRDRTRNPDGTPRAGYGAGVPVLDDHEAAWAFVASYEPPTTLDDAYAFVVEPEELAYPELANGWIGDAPRPTTYTLARHRCRACSGFVAATMADCARCGERGPHAYGEDAPTTGNAPRRARLRAVQRARKGLVR